MRKVVLWGYDYGKSNSPWIHFAYHLKDIDNIEYRSDFSLESKINDEDTNWIIVSYHSSHKIRSVIDDPIVSFHLKNSNAKLLYTWIYEYSSLDDNCSYIPEEIKDEVLLGEAYFCHNSFVQRPNIMGFNPFRHYYSHSNSYIKEEYGTLSWEIEPQKERDISCSVFLGKIDDKPSRNTFRQHISNYGMPNDSVMTWYPDRLIEGEIRNNGKQFDLRPEILASKFHVVFETRPLYPTITEKFFKPLMCGVPFIWVAYPGMCTWLENNGYKLFPFIDYFFDTLPSEEDRCHHVIFEYKRLLRVLKQKHIEEHFDIIEHNRNNFYKTYERDKQKLYEVLAYP